MEDPLCDVTLEYIEDPDAVFPDVHARPLVVSSQLLLISSAAAFYVAAKRGVMIGFGVGAALLFLYITSVCHWHKPRFSSVARILDYAAVFTAVTVGSAAAVTATTPAWIAVWFVGLALIAAIFAVNETLYYVQVMKTPAGGEGLATEGLWGFLPTKPNTPERDAVYRRTATVHMLLIHVLANALALALIIGGLR